MKFSFRPAMIFRERHGSQGVRAAAFRMFLSNGSALSSFQVRGVALSLSRTRFPTGRGSFGVVEFIAQDLGTP